ncbi:MAG: T9SS type A sorting domain-containing protein [Chitinophagaceae bacterium]
MKHLFRTTPTAKSLCERVFFKKAFSLFEKNKSPLYLGTLFLFVLLTINTRAQTSYTWNFTSAAASGTNANLTVDTFKSVNSWANVTAPIRASSSVSNTYSGFSAGNNLGNTCKGGALVLSGSTGTASAAFELTLTPAAGYIVTVTGISFGSRSTGTGPQRYVVKNSKDSYVDSMASGALSNNSTWAYQSPTTTSVSSAAGTPITLRIYGYNGTATGTPNSTFTWRIDDVVLNVTVTSAEVAPVAPTSGGNQSICFGTSSPNLSASAPNGAVVDWYDAASGGNLVQASSNTFSTNATTVGTYTYYTESRNNPGTLKSATRTAVTLTINPVVTPTIEIDATDLQPALGDPLDLYINDQSNQGSSPTYQWYKNGSPIPSATASTYSTTSFANGDEFYLVLTSNAACLSTTTAQSNSLFAIVNSSACSGTPPTATTTTSSLNICSGGTTNLALTGLGASTGYTFQWQSSLSQNGTYNDVVGQTNSTYSATITAATSTSIWYKCVVTCTGSGISTGSTPVQVNINANVNPLVSISTNSNPSCANSLVTYTATPVNGGTTPSYAWYVNGNLVIGQNNSTYSSSSFTNGDKVNAVLTSNYACLSSNNVSSDTINQTVTTNVVASVSIASSANPSCSGAFVTFTATPTNGGTPSYQWYNGANPIIGETSATYTSSSITTGSSITVRMVSSITCVTGSPATSNSVVQTVTANVTPSLTIASNNNPVCVSGNATFNINPVNAGSSPVYAWYLNGSLVNGQSGTTYTLSPVTDGDSVYATMISSTTCVTTANATSNVVKQTIVTQTAPTVSIAANPGTSIFEGTNITFTATPTFGGTTPTYQWKVNGSNVGTGLATYSSSLLANGDVVSCAMVSNYTCATTPNATSNNLTITILSANPFTPGNIIVYKVGDSATALSGNGSPIFLNEYTTSGAFVQSKRITRTTAGVTTMYSAGTTTSEGFISLNTNGTNLVVPGYNSTSSNATALGSTSATTTRRVVAFVDMNQNIDTTTKLKDVSGNMRSVVASGNTIYASSSSGGVRYASKGDSVSTQLSTTVTNLRNLGLFNGQLYTSTSSGSAVRLGAVGTGMPTTTGQTIVNLSGIPTNLTSPYGFFFADLSSSVAGVDVVYIADDGANTISKYSLVGTSWTSNGTIAASGVRGLVGSVSGSSVTLYGTATVSTPSIGTFVYSFTDNSGYNTALSGSITSLISRSSVSLIAFRGIAFAPTTFTSQPSNTSICTGSTGTLSVTMATGTSASIYAYQWQTSTNGSNWSNVSNGSVYSNVTTASLSITNPTLTLNNSQYRCVVTYMGTTTMISNAVSLTVIETVIPSISIATSNINICSGSATTFIAQATSGGSSPSYQWNRNGINVGSGSSIDFLPGTLSTGDIISCELTANNVCQTTATANSNTIIVNVKTSPVVNQTQAQNGAVITAASICALGSASTTRFGNTTPFGTWSSSNPSVATVNYQGFVTANSNGTATISYSIASSNGCVSSSTVLVTVAPATAPNAISGASNVCAGSSITLSSTTPNGVWSCPQTSQATVNPSTGVLLGKSAGSATINYTTTNANGCTAFVSKTIIVNPLPAVPTIAYAPGTSLSGPTSPFYGAPSGSFCVGKTFNLVGSPSVPAGVWSATGAASITNIGGVTINSVGAGTIKYTYTSLFGCVNSRTISGNGFACAARGIVTNDKLETASDFVLYPNPAKSIININVETLVGKGSIIVSDLYGKQIKIQMLSMGINTLDITKLSKGIYFVSLITNEGKTTKKLIVE